MARVLGIGGVFFKADDPAAVADWYRRVLGFDIQAGWNGAMWPPPSTGYSIWSPFSADTDYMAPSTQPFMVNFVVDDLDGVLARAQAAGVEPVGRNDADPNGSFAWLMDPAGVKIELWQPKGPSPFT
ncbi:VOC family protein [Brevundimonas sp.]|uniref:VOC family protein n=1 Tax=Brevundimonas sp. TaxID=1871086 RepID=UPI002ABC3D95|nr:VOC family protein [Brevundimonas sp.]MDZ4364046.1 VOC family protein [Brevundimonas sp.]